MDGVKKLFSAALSSVLRPASEAGPSMVSSPVYWEDDLASPAKSGSVWLIPALPRLTLGHHFSDKPIIIYL